MKLYCECRRCHHSREIQIDVKENDEFMFEQIIHRIFCSKCGSKIFGFKILSDMTIKQIMDEAMWADARDNLIQQKSREKPVVIDDWPCPIEIEI